MRTIVVDDDGNQIVVPTTTEVASYVKRNRKERGMSLQAVAEACGVKRQAVWTWEKGKCLPDIDNLKALMALFGPIVSNPPTAQVTVVTQTDDMEQTLNDVERIFGI